MERERTRAGLAVSARLQFVYVYITSPYRYISTHICTRIYMHVFTCTYVHIYICVSLQCLSTDLSVPGKWVCIEDD